MADVDSETFHTLCKECGSIAEVLDTIGLAKSSASYRGFHRRLVREGIETPFPMGLSANRGRRFPGRVGIPDDEFFVKGVSRKGASLKKRLLASGDIEDRCGICGMAPEWEGKPLTLRLDHINGEHLDNRKENLRLACPNCDSQLPTYGGRNSKRKDIAEDYRPEASEADRATLNSRRRERYHARPKQSVASKRRDVPAVGLLLGQVERHGYSGTGRLYGVSDNAIRKWILSYGVTPPRRPRGPLPKAPIV